jgi:subtilisin family serine protease
MRRIPAPFALRRRRWRGRHIWGIAFLAILTLAIGAQAAKQTSPTPISGEMATNRIIVKLSGDGANIAEAGHSGHRPPAGVDALNRRYGLRRMDPIARGASRRNAAAAAELGLDRAYVLTYDHDIDPVALSQEYAACPGVEYAEPDWIRRADWAPNDAYAPLQYGLGYIQAPAAWDVTRGSPTIVVAINDSGIDPFHPEFSGKLLPGYDFVDGYSTTDWFGHGTHVAGIVAAVAGNGIGIAGVAPNCKLLPVRVLDADGMGYASDCAAGVVWAADNGANVINMSYGCYVQSVIEWDAIVYAMRLGVTCVASKGNDETWEDHFPSDYPGVIAVGANDTLDEDWLPSNYGPHMWLKAPGVDIISTMPTYPVTLNGPLYGLSMNYDFLSGTSMAAPHVSGAAALMLSLNPALDPFEVAYLLARSADDMGDPGFDWIYGYGRLNLYRAVIAVLGDMSHNVGVVSIATSPSGISVGQSGEIDVRVRNGGTGAEAPMTVRVWVDGALLGTATPTLWPGEETTLPFAWTPTQAKSYQVTAHCYPRFGTDVSPGDDEQTVRVTPALFDVGITNMGVLPAYPYAGAWNRIRITVANHGTWDETAARVKVYVDDEQVDCAKIAAVPVGGQVDVDFFWAPSLADAAYFLATPISARHTLVARVESGLGADVNRADNYRRRNAFVDAHNMSVTQVYVPGTPQAGVAQTVRVVVKNSGTRTETDAVVKAYVNGQLVFAPLAVTLDSGASTAVDFPWTPPQAGYYTLEARTEPSAQPDIYRADNYLKGSARVH